MKVFGKLAIAFAITVVLVLVFIVINSLAKNEEVNLKEKTLSELKYFESKIVDMYNLLNNIEFENYQISINDVGETSKKSSDNEEKGKEKSGEESSNSEDESKNSGEDNQNSEVKTSSNEQNDKKYSLRVKGVLTDNGKIKWDNIKADAEILENSISSIMLDLYELSLDNMDVLNFTKEYDNLLVNIKKEDKENTLIALNTIYSYLPKFIDLCGQDEQYKRIIDIKEKIFAAYSILYLDDWNNIDKYITEAIDIYSKLLTNIDINIKNQYIINKCYITLNGLKNCIDLKDKEIFLIKYKNILEDFNSL